MRFLHGPAAVIGEFRIKAGSLFSDRQPLRVLRGKVDTGQRSESQKTCIECKKLADGLIGGAF